MIKENSREELVHLIRSSLFESADENFVSNVKKIIISDDKFTIEEYLKFKIYPEQLLSLPIQELYWFVDAMQQCNSKYKVLNYYTEFEVRDFKRYVKPRISIQDLLILKNAFPLAENQWSCVASVEQIALMRKHGLIRVDAALQRQSKEVKTIKEAASDNILRQIYVNWSRVDEIVDDLKNGVFHFNTLRFNLMDDGDFQPIYDNNKRLIILPVNGDIIELDGNHRTLAIERVYFQNPELAEYFRTVYFQIAFTFYDERKARACISQEWKVERVIEKHRKAMENSFANSIVDEIKRNNRSERIYADRIVTTGKECSIGNGFIVHSIFSDAIDRYYQVNKFKLKSQTVEITDWLITFLNYLSVLMVDDFSNYNNVKKYRWSVKPHTWTGYIYLSYVLYNDPDWKSKLKAIIMSINWDNANNPTNDLSEAQKLKAIEQYFQDKWGCV